MGIFNKLFCRNKETNLTPEIAEKIIQVYGTHMQNESPSPLCVADVKKLLFSKDQIKEALIIGMRATSDPHMKEMLKVAYFNLANYQEGVGEVNQGINISGFNPDDVKKSAQTFLQQYDNFEKWNSLVEEEIQSLRKELIDLGFW